MKTGLAEGQTDHVARLGRCTGMMWYQSACHCFVKGHEVLQNKNNWLITN
jgi:hypothetical protein